MLYGIGVVFTQIKVWLEVREWVDEHVFQMNNV